MPVTRTHAHLCPECLKVWVGCDCVDGWKLAIASCGCIDARDAAIDVEDEARIDEEHERFEAETGGEG